MSDESFGTEFIVDLHECTVENFTRESIAKFFVDLCVFIDMERCDLHFWDYEGYPDEYKDAPDHLKGISAVQFIKTSNITIHTLDVLKRVYLNVFSCKYFNHGKVRAFALNYFGGKVVNEHVMQRI